MQPPPRIVITGASGSVGVLAMPLARVIGAYIVGTCGTSNVDFVRDLGADEIPDSKQNNSRTLAEKDPSRNLDFVLDCRGGSSLEQAWHEIEDGGQGLTIVPPADMHWVVLHPPEDASKTISGKFFVMHPSGKVKARVDSVCQLDEHRQAFERWGSGRTRSNIILIIDDE
ncbi:hypothetical protein A1O1_07904 [Capronia coronata CBS 617.96]|uniref:Alcohol dehydrogenase-like C-terminal domain-containing protein n=1 Tax=Capronia coronata CBS 617.96 TaxID=1182541 RepID=W9YHU6_9EURO|nr:uncharacterized protein A1O1_07904 [Capronia coronata CBS 617.96]EXJ81839.1 hypothetical protein A1O1_07904 [Capronia coronata CBS 617.96]